MPTYDFQCRRCGQLFEHRMGMYEYGAGARPHCPSCGDPKPDRAFTGPIHILIGGHAPEFCKTPDSCQAEGGGSCGAGVCANDDLE